MMGVRPPLPPPSGEWVFVPRTERLDITADATFEGWVNEGGTRTLEEYCAEDRQWVSYKPPPPPAPPRGEPLVLPDASRVIAFGGDVLNLVKPVGPPNIDVSP